MSNNNQVRFMENHRPALRTGDYTISVTQTLLVDDDSGRAVDESFSSTKSLTIAGPRFSLDPAAIYTRFPPPNSVGEHSNVLPHISFYRATLPWERLADVNDDDAEQPATWLALLAFTEAEASRLVTTQATRLDLFRAGLPYPEQEAWENDADPVTLIEVSTALLNSIVPSYDELKLTAHARSEVDADGNILGEEVAIVVCNRMPTEGGTTIVHLVSLEGHYSDGVFYYADPANEGIATAKLVSLHSWKFACVDEKQNFRALLEKLDGAEQGDVAVLRLPDATGGDAEANDAANNFVRRGYVPLNLLWRNGGTAVSWLHGPLIPGERALYNPETHAARDLTQSWAPYELGRAYGFNLPAPSADALLRYQPDTSMMDVSYAAAWELGKLLALRDKTFSVGLYNWKRTAIRAFKNQPNASLCDYLPIAPGMLPDEYELPAYQRSWLLALSRLEGVPFNYLVPHESMLPLESIRFFRTDPLWIICLLDGAFSMGRVLAGDLLSDAEACCDHMPRFGYNVSGILLRSQAVSGWPNLVVTGYDREGAELTVLRQARLGDQVLLYLFAGDVAATRVSQKPEGIHFGFDRDPEPEPTDTTPYHKELRQLDGSGYADAELVIEDSHFRDRDVNRRVLDFTLLMKQIAADLRYSGSTLNAAQFGLEMVVGVEAVLFQRADFGSTS